MITYLKLGLYSLIICFSSLSFGLQCRSLFDSYKPAYHQHTENRSHFETNFKNWLNTALSKDFTNNNLSKFRAKFRNASRWQFIRQNMTSPLKELLNLARPEFFTDQIPPSPEQLTIAMQTIYDRLQVPEVIRILPGLILFNPSTRQYKPFRYVELKSQWPEGFIVPETNLSDLIILDGFNHGVMHLDWQTSIHEKFKVHMFYHDLNHLVSFLEPEYLRTLRSTISVAFKKGRETYLQEETFADFIEEFWLVKPEDLYRIQRHLPKFSLKNDLHWQTDIEPFIYPDGLIEKWKALDEKAKLLKSRIEAEGAIHSSYENYSLVRTYVIEKMSPALATEYTDLKNSYQQVFHELRPGVLTVINFFENHRHLIGAALADGLSVRAPHYADGMGYFRNVSFIRDHLKEFENIGQYQFAEFNLYYSALMYELYIKAKFPYQGIRQYVERRL